MKGIAREVMPYEVEARLDASGKPTQILSEHMTGLDFYLDPNAVEADATARIRAVLQKALAALDDHTAIPSEAIQPG